MEQDQVAVEEITTSKDRPRLWTELHKVEKDRLASDFDAQAPRVDATRGLFAIRECDHLRVAVVLQVDAKQRGPFVRERGAIGAAIEQPASLDGPASIYERDRDCGAQRPDRQWFKRDVGELVDRRRAGGRRKRRRVSRDR